MNTDKTEEKQKPKKQSAVKRFFSSPTRSCIALLSLVVVLLSCCLVTATTGLGLGWIHTYRVFTQETIIAEIRVSETKYDGDNNPYIEVYYLPVQGQSGIQGWIGISDYVEENAELVELPGDAFRVQADFFKWHDFGTFLGLKPMFKVTRVAGDYVDITEYNSLDHKAEELNGGSDGTWQFFKNNSENYTWVGTAYTSSAGQNATDKARTFELIATEDGLILRNQTD